MSTPLPVTQGIVGQFQRHAAVASRYLDLPRTVTVWLPPGYAEEPDRRYPVVYLTDGQQVFDPATSTHGVDWGVDDFGEVLIRAGQVEPFIAVAADSTAERAEEYDPAVRGADYAKFATRELKPMIDSAYRTMPDRAHTSTAGASRGGAVAFHLAWTHPHLFGAAICLSPAFAYQGTRMLLDEVKRSDITPDLRLYLYVGGGDELERTLTPGTREMAELLQPRLRIGPNLILRETPEAAHNEAAWRAETPEWLHFLYGTRSRWA